MDKRIFVHKKDQYKVETKMLLNEFEELKDKLIIGGGVNRESVNELESLGIKKALIGTSIHNGEIKIIPSL